MIKKLSYKIMLLLFRRCLYPNVGIQIIGRENIPKPPFIIVSNHNHPADPNLIVTQFKTKVHFFVGDIGYESFLFRKGLLNKIERIFGGIPRFVFDMLEQIPIKIGDNQRNEKAYSLAEEYLNKGEIVGIFQEGYPHRKKKNKYFLGIARLLLRKNVPILPINIKVNGPMHTNKLKPNFTKVKILIKKPKRIKVRGNDKISLRSAAIEIIKTIK